MYHQLTINMDMYIGPHHFQDGSQGANQKRSTTQAAAAAPSATSGKVSQVIGAVVDVPDLSKNGKRRSAHWWRTGPPRRKWTTGHVFFWWGGANTVGQANMVYCNGVKLNEGVSRVSWR